MRMLQVGMYDAYTCVCMHDRGVEASQLNTNKYSFSLIPLASLVIANVLNIVSHALSEEGAPTCVNQHRADICVNV